MMYVVQFVLFHACGTIVIYPTVIYYKYTKISVHIILLHGWYGNDFRRSDFNQRYLMIVDFVL